MYEVCYNTTAVDPFRRKGGANVDDMLTAFILSVMAGVVANLISKWLDRKM
jgi:hypothetical protein